MGNVHLGWVALGIFILFLAAGIVPVSAAEITIDNTTPGGISGAISQANNGDTIVLNPGTYFEHGIDVSKDITIKASPANGGNATNTIIDGLNSGSIFQARSIVEHGSWGWITTRGVFLSIDNVTLRNGNSVTGGAIHSMGGPVTITSSVITHFQATGGGVIEADALAGERSASGPVTIISSTISDCKATGGGVVSADGGPVTVISSAITDCHATTGGAIESHSHVYNPDMAAVNISSSRFVNCSATSGGAIYSRGGPVTVENTTFMDSSATRGSAITVTFNPFPGTSRLTVSNSTFVNNKAVRAMIYSLGATVTVKNSAFICSPGSRDPIEGDSSTITIVSTTFVNCPGGRNTA
ncbi:MAG TPA: hypothetical protein PKM50_04215 [Methanoregula sp.]|nr:hypothetical protein [Methanoregula sp.]